MSGLTPWPSAEDERRARAVEEERRARAAWSHIAEPTDAVAHLARRVLGASRALALALEATPTEALDALGGSVPTVVGEEARGSVGSANEPGRPGATSGIAVAPRSREEARVAAALERWRQRWDRLDLDAALDAAQRRGLRLLVPGDPAWPPALADLGDAAPHCLWARGPGDPADLTAGRPAVALVGSRASTPYGEDIASGLASSLADRGACVVSGGAYGIDAAAHRGALAAGGSGATVAVLAGGLDALYPRGNARLLEAIGARHLLVSEAPMGTAPTRWRFLARNRLIAALTATTVVVEASWRSGALSTARHADDLSRPVAAVPGPITSAASAGCHRLIRERGAVLVTDAAEVLELVRGQDPAGSPDAAAQDELDLLAPADRRVLDAVPPRSAMAVDALGRECALPTGAVEAALARLEVLGLVRRTGERVARAR